jgi:DNA-binding response OmpR family regulator
MHEELGNSINILICNRDADLNTQLAEILRENNYRLDFISGTTEVLKKILTGRYDAIILELDMDTEMGVETIPIINQIDNTLPIITITNQDSVETQRQVRRGKIFYYLVKPISGEEIKSALEYAIAKHYKI